MKLEEILEWQVWKTHGAVSTPLEVVDLMLRLCGVEKWANLDILEPGCGFCDFLARIQSKHPDNNFTGIEINDEIYNIALSLYPHFNLIMSDFLLWKSEQKYDLVIGNPPYGIIGDKSHYPLHTLKDKKPLYKKVFTTWFGKYNIYGAFIEKGVSIVKEGGELVYIVPATFMILDEFKILRRFLAASGRVKVFYLGPNVFKDRSVSTVILIIQNGLRGIELYEVKKLKDIVKCYRKEKYAGEIIRFDTAETRAFEKKTLPLGHLFSVHFAARSTEVKKHNLVSKESRNGFVPVLTGRNLHRGWIDYDRCYSGYWLPKEAASSLREYYSTPHIVVGHTKGGKVVAAVDNQGYPWREEMHLLPKTQGIDLRAVTEYLNSGKVGRYMRTLYKDITPHLTATQLKLLPVLHDLFKGQYLWKPL